MTRLRNHRICVQSEPQARNIWYRRAIVLPCVSSMFLSIAMKGSVKHALRKKRLLISKSLRKSPCITTVGRKRRLAPAEILDIGNQIKGDSCLAKFWKTSKTSVRRSKRTGGCALMSQQDNVHTKSSARFKGRRMRWSFRVHLADSTTMKLGMRLKLLLEVVARKGGSVIAR